MKLNTSFTEAEMKLKTCAGLAVVAMAMFVAVGAAKSKDSKNLLVHYDATIAGTHLTSGEYAVEMESHNPAVTVSFSRGKTVVATVQGKIVDRGTRFPANQVVYGADANGGHAIQEIRFKGSTEVIVFE